MLREQALSTFESGGARGPPDDPPYHSSSAAGASLGESFRPSAFPKDTTVFGFFSGTLIDALDRE